MVEDALLYGIAVAEGKEVARLLLGGSTIVLGDSG
jgi:hypothetical protein